MTISGWLRLSFGGGHAIGWGMHFWLVLILLPVSPVALAGDHVGVPRVIDGDSFYLGDSELRLDGIDAPEWDQRCNSRWIGRLAAQRLREAGSLSCRDVGNGGYGRRAVICRERSAADIGRRMLAAGLVWRSPYPRFRHAPDWQDSRHWYDRGRYQDVPRPKALAACEPPWDFRRRVREGG